MLSHTFERTSTKKLYRVVDTRSRNWEWYWFGTLNRQKLPKEDGMYLRSESSIINNGWPKDKWFIDWIRDLPKEESERIFKEATDRGSRAHRAIEMLFAMDEPKGGGYSGFNVSRARKSILNRSTPIWDDKEQEEVRLKDADWHCVLSFDNFWRLHKPIVFAVSSGLYNLSIEWAGTTDITGWILTQDCGLKQCPCTKVIGKVGLPDLKTTTAIRDTHGMQVAAFADADNISDFLKGRTLEYTADLRLGTQHVNTKGYEFVIYDRDETARNFENFLHALAIDWTKRKPFNPDKEIRNIPDHVEIQIRPVPTIKSLAKKMAKLKSNKKVVTKQAKKTWKTSKQKSQSSVKTAPEQKRNMRSVKVILTKPGANPLTRGKRKVSKKVEKNN